VKPLIAVTMGEPAGVGPEVVARALDDASVWECCTPLVFGQTALLNGASRKQGLSVRFVDAPAPVRASGRAEVPVLAGGVFDASAVVSGHPSPATGQAVIGWIEAAARLALAGGADAMATGPIDKAILRQAGFPFPGHTEFLASLCGAPHPVMMLASPRLRVILATIHLRIEEVPARLAGTDLLRLLRIAHAGLRRDFALSAPRLLVAALNPHGGEGGMFGEEEARLIRPAVEKAVAEGIDARGPLPADTLFFQALRGGADAVVCMYHDQGLIPLKMDGFMQSVNVTLGLPIVRTSVDHGTAYDLAGTGRADPSSLVAALRMAARMAQNRAQNREKA
jgi:4-hydroxythreonine-4-phosphate dehydrogenase